MSFSPVLLGSGVAGYNFLNRTRDTQQALYNQSPLVSRDIAKFKEQIQNIGSTEELMDNRDMLRVALGAFGRDEDINNRAFIERVLDSDLGDSTSLANRLADKRYLALAEAFNFKGDTGPQLETESTQPDISAQLARLKTSDDLLTDGPLLRAALDSFGLKSNAGDVYFLKQVLESDLSEPGSFANQLSDPRYAEFSEVFGFGEKVSTNESLTAFAALFEGQFEDLETAEDLAENDVLFEAALKMFNLDNEVYRPDFMVSVLTSDLSDPASPARAQNDPRYVAITEAFGFNRTPATAPDVLPPSVAEKFVTAVLARAEPLQQPSDVFTDFRLFIATSNFFDLPTSPAQTRYAQRLLEADQSDPQSLAGLLQDQRYVPFVNAFDFKPLVEERTYPPGFAEAITTRYSERQFEIEVGNSDNAMRVALALERELDTVIEAGTTEDSRWFAVLASPALRSVFETAFRLPSSFGTLDIDLQLNEFKARSERFFDTTDVADFAVPDTLDALRQSYLLQQGSAPVAGTGSSAGLALALLSGFQV